MVLIHRWKVYLWRLAKCGLYKQVVFNTGGLLSRDPCNNLRGSATSRFRYARLFKIGNALNDLRMYLTVKVTLYTLNATLRRPNVHPLGSTTISVGDTRLSKPEMRRMASD